jgi:hypothetical protein
MAQRAQPQFKRAPVDALDSWLRLANDAGLLKRPLPQQSAPMQGAAGSAPGPDIPENTPVELPQEQPGESPAGSPEEHPDSVPGEVPGTPPDEVPQGD